MAYNSSNENKGASMNNSLNIPEIINSDEINPADILRLKSITLGNFLSEIKHPAFSEDSFELDGYIFDFFAGVTDNSTLFEAYLAETGENIPVCEVYENLSSGDLQSEIMDHYACLKSNFLILSKLYPNNME